MVRKEPVIRNVLLCSLKGKANNDEKKIQFWFQKRLFSDVRRHFIVKKEKLKELKIIIHVVCVYVLIDDSFIYFIISIEIG